MIFLRALSRQLAPVKYHGKRCLSSGGMNDLFNPTETHTQLRSMLRDFVRNEV